MIFLEKFRLGNEREDFQTVYKNIHSGIEFKGTNLWILIFAIFIASLGLNVNSPAVIIGAMLVSPLMGPITGMGFGMAINDLTILKKSLSSFLFATCVSLATSTLFFLLSPINDAHSEILARTSPNIYDVLIALFGGLAGILAISSKLKGNVIPGVAIATALMPPLCTAGYGLATLQMYFFFGALYLFLINTVFIALATVLTTRFLKYPFTHLPEKKDEIRAQRIIGFMVSITLVPSIYFGYDLVKQNDFTKKAERYINYEANFPNNYLLKKNINPKNQTITLVYGGQSIDSSEIKKLRSQLHKYQLEGTTLKIKEGFTYLKNEKSNKQFSEFSKALQVKENEIISLKNELRSYTTQKSFGNQIFKELKIQYPSIESCSLQNVTFYSEKSNQQTWIAIINSKNDLNTQNRIKIKNWLKVRLNVNTVQVYFE
ncbi:MAG: DUF389 domain-containing protein [Flavobacterium sp.]